MNQDAQLIQQILAGDTGALEQLVRKHYGSIYAQIRLRTRHPEDAEDIAQDVFLKAYQNLTALRRPERFDVWLRQIARHECQNRLRRKRPDIRPLTAAESDHDLSAEARLIQDETLERTMRAIDRLPALERDLLKSRYLDDITYADLQKIHSLSYKALTMRILRAKRKVRKALEKTFAEIQSTPDEEALSSAAIPSQTSKHPQKGEPAVYHTPFEFTAPYAAKKDGKFGYIDRTGEMIIPPQFDRAMGFVEGLGRVGIGDKHGYIDKTGSSSYRLNSMRRTLFAKALPAPASGSSSVSSTKPAPLSSSRVSTTSSTSPKASPPSWSTADGGISINRATTSPNPNSPGSGPSPTVWLPWSEKGVPAISTTRASRSTSGKPVLTEIQSLTYYSHYSRSNRPLSNIKISSAR